MNLDHPNNSERQMKESLQEHEFPFDPSAWQDMKAKLAASSAESTAGAGQSSSDSDLPPGTSFTKTIFLIMAIISVFSIALWFGLATPEIDNTAINLENNLYKTTNTEMAGNATEKEGFKIDEKTETFTNNNNTDGNLSKNNFELNDKNAAKASTDFNKIKNTGFSKNKSLVNNTNVKSNQGEYLSFSKNEKMTDKEDGFLETKTILEKSNLENTENLSGENTALEEIDASNHFESLAFLETLPLEALEVNEDDTDTIHLPLGIKLAKKPIRFSNTDIKFGVGNGFFDPGDNSMIILETEVSNKWNRYIANSISLNYGTMYRGISESLSQFHADMNFLFSPFKNNKRSNFKLGTGISYLYVDEVAFLSSRFENGVQIIEYDFSKRSSIGTHFIIEHEISITPRHLLGFKASYYSYKSGDSISGISVKFGVKL